MNLILGSLVGAVLALVGVWGPWTLAPEQLRLNEIEAAAWAWLPLLVLAGVCLLLSLWRRRWSVVAVLVMGLLGAFVTLWAFKDILASASVRGGLWGFWCTFGGMLLVTLGAMWELGTLEGNDRTARVLRNYLPPATVPFLLFLLWEGLTEGLRIPMAFFPRATDVAAVLVTSYDVLIQDTFRTVFKQVLAGYVLGVSAGLLVGLLVAYSVFLRRGFLPLATAFSAIPIVGLAPVLGRAFGVDWKSKAAVAVIVSFFPMVINTVQGLITIDPLKLDLMSSYAANPRQILTKLRIPNALPYIFNALKIASIIVLISVIVAEFLIPGPPEGLGQRISLSARSGRYDVTFAAIAFASVIGILFYNIIALLERVFTSWHSSFRDK